MVTTNLSPALCLVALAVGELGAAAATEKEGIRNWPTHFRGAVRVWRCDWGLDEAGAPMPASLSIFVSENHWADEGYEHILAHWGAPYRHDLTPDLILQR